MTIVIEIKTKVMPFLAKKKKGQGCEIWSEIYGFYVKTVYF